jgi:hypothetical protein
MARVPFLLRPLTQLIDLILWRQFRIAEDLPRPRMEWIHVVLGTKGVRDINVKGNVLKVLFRSNTATPRVCKYTGRWPRPATSSAVRLHSWTMLIGGAALVAVFLASWPLMAGGIALALQLQISRVFWMLDFLAAVYLAWLFAEAPRSRNLRRTAMALAIAAAVGRGAFVWGTEHAGNPIVRVGFPRDNWTDAMQWISRSPPDTYVLADPGHAWKYGSSVRVTGERDVYLEEVKDLALALYSRDIAMEALRRIADVPDFESLTAGQLRALAGRYGLHYLVVDRDVDLPVVYRNEQFRVYALK